jgi:hypothetical protein
MRSLRSWSSLIVLVLVVAALVAFGRAGPELVYAERPTALELVPRPSGVTVTLRRIGCLATGGACQIVATWVKPANWRATDSLRVQWSQVTPTANANLRRRYTRGLVDTLPLTRAEGLAYDGKLVITTFRVGTLVSASTTPASWAAPAIAVPDPDTVGSVTVISLILKPDSAKVAVPLPGQVATDSNRVQFCTAARLSDDTVILAENSKGQPGCDLAFTGFAGYRLSSAHRIQLRPGGLQVLVEGRTPELPMTAAGVLTASPYQWVVPRVPGAMHVGGEWWLSTPIALPSSS